MRMLNGLEANLLGLLPAALQACLCGAHTANKAIVRSAFWLVLFVLAAEADERLRLELTRHLAWLIIWMSALDATDLALFSEP